MNPDSSLSAGHEPSGRAAHNDVQRAYYAERRPVRMVVTDSAYVRLHFERAAAAVELRRGDEVGELGAGMGRFTRRFAEAGHRTLAVELSPALGAACREAMSPWPEVEVLVADLADAPRLTDRRFDVVAGFFMLHHLTDLEQCFRAVHGLLRPGGRCVFVEPNPANPLYALQVTFTPGMRWSAERGIYKMWSNDIRRQFEVAGLVDFSCRRYGFFPRALHNACAGGAWNGWLERLTPPGLRPFQVFTARKST